MKTTSEIKDFLWRMCNEVVSDKVYTTSKPRIIPEGIKDFVVVSNPGYLEDITDKRQASYQQTIAMIELYVKNEAGIENTAKIHQMETSLIAAMNSNADEDFNIVNYSSFSTTSIEDFNVVIFTINIITK